MSAKLLQMPNRDEQASIDRFFEEYRRNMAKLSASKQELKPLSLWAKAHLRLFGRRK